jgi:hypothetical protein
MAQAVPCVPLGLIDRHHATLFEQQLLGLFAVDPSHRGHFDGELVHFLFGFCGLRSGAGNPFLLC